MEFFIEALRVNYYSYKLTGTFINVNHNGGVNLTSLVTLPEGVQFNNEGDLYLKNIDTRIRICKIEGIDPKKILVSTFKH